MRDAPFDVEAWKSKFGDRVTIRKVLMYCAPPFTLLCDREIHFVLHILKLPQWLVATWWPFNFASKGHLRRLGTGYGAPAVILIDEDPYFPVAQGTVNLHGGPGTQREWINRAEHGKPVWGANFRPGRKVPLSLRPMEDSALPIERRDWVDRMELWGCHTRDVRGGDRSPLNWIKSYTDDEFDPTTPGNVPAEGSGLLRYLVKKRKRKGSSEERGLSGSGGSTSDQCGANNGDGDQDMDEGGGGDGEDSSDSGSSEPSGENSDTGSEEEDEKEDEEEESEEEGGENEESAEDGGGEESETQSSNMEDTERPVSIYDLMHQEERETLQRVKDTFQSSKRTYTRWNKRYRRSVKKFRRMRNSLRAKDKALADKQKINDSLQKDLDYYRRGEEIQKEIDAQKDRKISAQSDEIKASSELDLVHDEMLVGESVKNLDRLDLIASYAATVNEVDRDFDDKEASKRRIREMVKRHDVYKMRYPKEGELIDPIEGRNRLKKMEDESIFNELLSEGDWMYKSKKFPPGFRSAYRRAAKRMNFVYDNQVEEDHSAGQVQADASTMGGCPMDGVQKTSVVVEIPSKNVAANGCVEEVVPFGWES